MDSCGNLGGANAVTRYCSVTRLAHAHELFFFRVADPADPDPADPVLNRGSTVADLAFPPLFFCFCCTLKDGQRG